MSYFKNFIPAIICVIIGCKSPSDKVVEDFKKVNDSLSETNKLYDSLHREVKFVGFDKAVADSLERLFASSTNYLDNLKNELDRLDGGGEKLDVAEKLLVKTAKGDSLYSYAKSTYYLGVQYGDSASKQEYSSLTKYDKDKWLERYFKKTPTIAAKTILAKIQNDFKGIKNSVSSAGIGAFKK